MKERKPVRDIESDLERCTVCNKVYDRRYLDQVFEHMHNDDIDPELGKGIKGKRIK